MAVLDIKLGRLNVGINRSSSAGLVVINAALMVYDVVVISRSLWVLP